MEETTRISYADEGEIVIQEEENPLGWISSDMNNTVNVSDMC